MDDKSLNVGNKWKYNKRYWTSGLRVIDNTFRWCSEKVNVNKSLWMDGQPNNVNKTENCAQMVVNTTRSYVSLDDRNCGVVSALACQVIEKILLFIYYVT
jgi:hypothetical protein